MNPNKVRVLLVDDEPKYTWILQISLEARGYVVLVAKEGPTAIDLAQKENPSIILLDIKMPGMNGYEVCQRIRAFSDVPIIMLTALGEDEDREKGIAVGANDYMTKPFKIHELLNVMQPLLSETPSEFEGTEAAPFPPEKLFG